MLSRRALAPSRGVGLSGTATVRSLRTCRPQPTSPTCPVPLLIKPEWARRHPTPCATLHPNSTAPHVRQHATAGFSLPRSAAGWEKNGLQSWGGGPVGIGFARMGSDENRSHRRHACRRARILRAGGPPWPARASESVMIGVASRIASSQSQLQLQLASLRMLGAALQLDSIAAESCRSCLLPQGCRRLLRS